MEVVNPVCHRDIAKAYTLIDAIYGIHHLSGFLKMRIDASEVGILEHTEVVLGQVFKLMCFDKLFEYVTFDNMNENQIADKFEVSNSLFAWSGYSESMVLEAHSIEYLLAMRNCIIEKLLQSSVTMCVDVAGINDTFTADKHKRVWSLVDSKCVYIASPKVMTSLMSVGRSVVEDVGDALCTSYVIGGVRFISNQYATDDYLLPIPKKLNVRLGSSLGATLIPSNDGGDDPRYNISHHIQVLPEITDRMYRIMGL